MMLAISPHDHEFTNEFLGGPMLEDFNFDDLFLDFNGKDVLPDLEVDPGEIGFGDFSFNGDDGAATAGDSSSRDDGRETVFPMLEENKGLFQENKDVTSSKKSKEVGTVEVLTENSPSPEADEEGRKSFTAKANGKGSHGKRKVKVDWTPELHRRFVEAVEQLGIDKAVPSRILELMGIDCLTRHNIASHLQKYRSHRKHLLAREAEAASWSHRRQMSCSPWVAPTRSFPPPPPPPPPPPLLHSLIRPLHVWGHPTMDMWPKHFIPGRGQRPSLPPPWVPHPSLFLPHYATVEPNGVTQGIPCFPPPVPPTMRFPPPTVPCIPPQHAYRAESTALHPNNKQLESQLQLLDTLPSKESVDAAIGDVLAKPCSPPLGLKPPSLESVFVELQKQGISKIPPTNA